MAAFNKFNSFVQDLARKVHALNTDSLKIMLVNSPAPSAANAVKANLTEIAAGNGYVAGGSVAAYVSDNDSAGVYKLILSPAVFTASGGGNIGPFEYAVLYNSSTASGNLIGWWDYGTPITLTNGNTFTVALDQTGGVFTLS